MHFAVARFDREGGANEARLAFADDRKFLRHGTETFDPILRRGVAAMQKRLVSR